MDRLTRTMDSFPPEVLLNIFSRLSVTSLLNVKLVCRKWHKLAREPLLINLLCSQMIDSDQCLILHCDNSVRNHLYVMQVNTRDGKISTVENFQVPIRPEFNVIGSCNGLLCLSNQITKNVLYVYNPAINCFAELPRATQFVDNWASFGLGVNPTTMEYKLVKITRNVIQTRRRNHMIMSSCAVEILTLGCSTWRNLGHTSYFPIASSSQVLVNGRLHWVNWTRKNHTGRILISFDLDSEKFQEVPKPDSAYLERQYYEPLVLGGCLSAAYYTDSAEWQIWIMKEYGVKNSWINEINLGNPIPRGVGGNIGPSSSFAMYISRSSCVQVLCRLKTGEIFLKHMFKALVEYDPISKTVKDIQIHRMPKWFEGIVLTSSFNLIDNLGGV